MKISIVGQHISLGGSFQEYVKERIDEVINKYFSTATAANIHFVKHGYLYHCDILINEGTGHHFTIKSDANSDEIYSSFDIAVAKLEKQLRKYKSKLKDRHGRIKPSETQEAIKYVMAPFQGEDFDSNIVDEEKHPLIIAEKTTQIPTLTVSEAVMTMDLEGLPALMFKNHKSNKYNLVYYKKDGNIAWVDSKD